MVMASLNSTFKYLLKLVFPLSVHFGFAANAVMISQTEAAVYTVYTYRLPLASKCGQFLSFSVRLHPRMILYFVNVEIETCLLETGTRGSGGAQQLHR